MLKGIVLNVLWPVGLVAVGWFSCLYRSEYVRAGKVLGKPSMCLGEVRTYFVVQGRFALNGGKSVRKVLPKLGIVLY